jgi:hypothetical protein
MSEATLTLSCRGARKTVSLSTYLTPAGEQGAHQDAYSWIKALRRLPLGGSTFRDRFAARNDSLWWFTEIYLHKERAVLEVFRTINAFETLIASERPDGIEVSSASVVTRHLIASASATMSIPGGERVSDASWWRRLAALDARARRLTLSAYATPDRYKRAPANSAHPRVAVFIHRAFWKDGGDEGSAESYIGPVLDELKRLAGSDAIRYVGVGPQTNFRERRRWTLLGSSSHAVVPVERYAPMARLQASRAIWRERYRYFRQMTREKAFRAAAQIRNVDCWPIVREQLAGVAWLQWPWSVRAMDEAAAALDTLRPASVLTYAEAGGWGRALLLEARRRGIPSIGLQHGFIYRQWLNYLHEPDEMRSEGDTGGFPVPTVTLVFDAYAAEHLRQSGRFAPERVRVTGSPKLDSLVDGMSRVSSEAIARIRRDVNAAMDDVIVLLTTKQREAAHILPALVSAAETVPNVLLLIKPHPGETADVYASVATGRSRVRIAPKDAPLGPLLAASRVLVTVNSTVALDAAVAGVPALVVGLPNNLSPFVEAGMLAGAESTTEIQGQLERVLYDEGFRQQLDRARRACLERYAMKSDGEAARRSAEAVLEVTRT